MNCKECKHGFQYVFDKYGHYGQCNCDGHKVSLSDAYVWYNTATSEQTRDDLYIEALLMDCPCENDGGL